MTGSIGEWNDNRDKSSSALSRNVFLQDYIIRYGKSVADEIRKRAGGGVG